MAPIISAAEGWGWGMYFKNFKKGSLRETEALRHLREAEKHMRDTDRSSRLYLPRAFGAKL